jgi:hypothetical protein
VRKLRVVEGGWRNARPMSPLRAAPAYAARQTGRVNGVAYDIKRRHMRRPRGEAIVTTEAIKAEIRARIAMHRKLHASRPSLGAAGVADVLQSLLDWIENEERK